eukprot:s1194_g3.t1
MAHRNAEFKHIGRGLAGQFGLLGMRFLSSFNFNFSIPKDENASAMPNHWVRRLKIKGEERLITNSFPIARMQVRGGQRTLVAQKEPAGGVLPSLDAGGSSASAAPATASPRGPFTPRAPSKQRGILSEPTTAVVPPKVIKVHHHRPGDIPRKVTVERQQKKFGGMDIEDLLLARGISFHKSRWDEGQWLSLNDFDNTEYDIRTPEQWIDMGKQADGLALPVLATGLRLGPDRTGSWQACVAIGHDGWGNSLVRWLDMTGEVEEESEPVFLTRLQILYNGEDPEHHADRIYFAFDSLRRAQSRAQLNFFIDNMPTDDIQSKPWCLDADQVSRVLELARNSPGLRENSLEAAANALVKEANLDFARTMNKIIFINNEARRAPTATRAPSPALFGFVSAEELEDDESPFDRQQLGVLLLFLPTIVRSKVISVSTSKCVICDRPVPMYSLWPVPEYSFTDLFSAFCFASLLIKPEVVSTHVALAEESLWLLSQTIYNLKYTEALRLDYFTQLQKTVITSTSERVKEKWVNKLQKIMLQHFTNVGKGWFSIHETNPDTYRQGKMRKLLSVIRFVMQDTLRYFALDSVGHYCEGLERHLIAALQRERTGYSCRPCDGGIWLQDLLHVESTFDPLDPEADKAAPRLFHKAACSYMEAQKHVRAHTGASASVSAPVPPAAGSTAAPPGAESTIDQIEGISREPLPRQVL